MLSVLPSTLSMVPRMRVGVGDCWAQALDTSTDATANGATTARGSHKEVFGMVFSAKIERRTAKNTPKRRGYSGPHGGRQPVAADADAVGLERSVRQLLDESNDLGAGLEIGFFGRNVGHNRRIGTDRDFLLAVLVFDHQGLAVRAGNLLCDRRVGHGRVGVQIVRPRSLAGAAHGLGEDVHLDRVL